MAEEIAITRSTPITFGAHKGTKLRDIPDAYLDWVIKNLKDTDFHRWALAAQKEKEDRTKGGDGGSAEEQANKLLREAGWGHLAEREKRKYQPRTRR